MNSFLFMGSATLITGNFLVWLVIGAISGSLASKIICGKGYGCLSKTLVGFAGTFIANFTFRLFFPDVYPGFWTQMIAAFLCTCILIIFLRSLQSRKKSP